MTARQLIAIISLGFLIACSTQTKLPFIASDEPNYRGSCQAHPRICMHVYSPEKMDGVVALTMLVRRGCELRGTETEGQPCDMRYVTHVCRGAKMGADVPPEKNISTALHYSLLPESQVPEMRTTCLQVGGKFETVRRPPAR